MIEFHTAANTTWGVFDYIICHGVYSWVADDVQDKILSICSKNLSPNGIAYVSYNTYPGWHMREIIRHAMRYHADQFEDNDKRIEQARALIDFLVSAVPAQTGYYGQLLTSELELVRRCRDSYLFHDHLEDVNAPIYFHQFVERAHAHHLQYLGEADFASMLTSGFANDVAETLDRISPDIIRSEQYMDFLRNRFFRQTLLCHSPSQLKRELDADSVRGLSIASNTRPAQTDQARDQGTKQLFRTPQGLSIGTDFALTAAALGVLNESWPKAITLDVLVEHAQARLATPEDKQNRSKLYDDLLHCYSVNAVEFHSWQADITVTISERPKVSDLTRYQLTHDQAIVNQRHETVNLDDVGKALTRLLDGTRNQESLLQQLHQSVERGSLVIERNHESLHDETVVRDALAQSLAQTLQKLAKAALLIA